TPIYGGFQRWVLDPPALYLLNIQITHKYLIFNYLWIFYLSSCQLLAKHWKNRILRFKHLCEINFLTGGSVSEAHCPIIIFSWLFDFYRNTILTKFVYYNRYK